MKMKVEALLFKNWREIVVWLFFTKL